MVQLSTLEKKRGVRAIMKEEMPWIAFVWCMAHRLELAIQDALKDTLLRISHLYQKSPKKLRELKVNKQIFLITLTKPVVTLKLTSHGIFVVSGSTKNLSINSEAVVRKFSSKYVLLKILQYSPGNTCFGVPFS